ncbi:hypothetical protein C0Q70_09287 [Pomacea canaliculata]|uniref:Uncharacterized protein n=1 Tax=Pomacea canaliculata TaxID=400727 RepID=A0A2T7P9E3_POMCA|nr:hypothetical protein C0Q70_09287 [Pomacea canaliculata]
MFKFCRLHHPQGLGYGSRLRWRIPHSLLYTPRLPVLFRSLLIAITIALKARSNGLFRSRAEMRIMNSEHVGWLAVRHVTSKV